MARREVNIAAILDGQLARVSESDTKGREQIEYIDLDLLEPDSRNFYSLPGIPELAENIRLVGLQQPLRVRPKENGHFEIVTGHRRHRALLRLAKEEGLAEFSQVPCIRERTGESASMEKVRLICGNCDNRTLTGAELARQAKEMDEALLGLQKEGFPLKGRRRTYVAQLLNVHETKLANVNAIRNGIKVPGIKERWERDEIPEAAALEIARLPVEAQYRLLDWVIDGHHSYSIRDVKQFAVMWGGCRKECPETGGFCQHAEAIYDHDFSHGVWSGTGCCQWCNKRATCPAVCQYARSVASTEGAGEEDLEENEPEEPGEINWTDRCKLIGDRLRACREQTGLDRAEFAERIGAYKATYSAWENGSLPGSSQFPDLARALGVSTDYLYGLTDEPSPRPTPTQWQPLDEDHWPAEGQLVVIAYGNRLGGNCYETARCVGGYHDLYPFEDTDVGCELDVPSHGDYEAGFWWIPLSERETDHG